MNLHLTPQMEFSKNEVALAELAIAEELVAIAENEKGWRPRKHPVVPPPPPHELNEVAIFEFEQRHDANAQLNEISPDGELTELELAVLKLLPNNLQFTQISKQCQITYDKTRGIISKLAKFNLITLYGSRRYWPNDRGFALIGIEPIPHPKQNNKAGASIYFGKGNPTTPKVIATPRNVTITETEEGYFINVNGATLDVPFDSKELAQRGAEAFLATKLIKKRGLADLYQRKRAALFQFMAEA